ncbi:GumC family protein [Nostoc parmelioides]|uniref:non-specific protein-tyrosine kinase n=1 Tax=Nostoc parmelioides FACHB-3921 TaxID=2692909 RepID=A0ABR8BB13_9NOSO|nr:polysaccharide biosynthesis tyrosine autokinase [Nostoc parmelioides]MBD2250950.1 polysaccharide biosynthesis tyrosine autokinase [Nostoc parmelioides FACHB-3921]
MTPPIVKSYIIAFEKYKWIGVASFALVVAGSTVVAIQPEPAPTYTASGTLTYSRPPVSFSTTGSEIQQQGQELNQEVLLSDQVIDNVSAKVKIPSRRIASSVAITPPRRNSRTGELESNVISLAYRDSDPKRAQEVLLELMQAMVKLSSDINTGRLKAIIGKINERIPQARSELQAAEKRLEQYDRIERPAILAAENGSLLGAVTGSQNQQRVIRQTITGIEAQIFSLQDKLGLDVGQSYVSSALSADPIIASLRSQIYQTESQIALLRKDLRPEHPNMIQLQRQKQASEELLQQRAAEVIGGGGTAAPLATNISGIRAQSSLDPARQQLANQMVALQTQKETLQQQLAQQIRDEIRLRQEYSQIPNKQLERSRLEQAVGLKKAVYDQMQAKLTDAQTAEAETVSSFSIAQPPVVGADAKKAKSVPLTLGVGGFLGLIVGGGVIFLLGSLEGTLRTREAIRDSLKQRDVAMLGEIPVLPVDDLPPEALPVILSLDSLYLEFYEKLRSNLRRIGGRNLKVVLVTSTSSQEGKTTSAYNLGIASARAGKRTLIIETDLRSPSRSTSLRVSADEDATLEPLRYYGSLSECIRLVPEVENLYIIPSPGPVRQSAAILESSEMRRLMEDVRERYDLVILDTSPLSVSNDPLLIQPYSDGIVLVSRVNYTQDSMMAEAIDQLVEAELGLVGVIINGADITVSLPPSAEFSDSVSGEERTRDEESEISVGVSNN